MITTILIFLAVILPVIILSTLVWKSINLTWLNQLCRWLIISLPFERIPSIPVGSSNIRISQVLTLIGCYFVIVLLLKKDPQLLRIKLNSIFWLSIAFFVTSLGSLYFVKDLNRYLTTEIATIICFLASILVSHFTIDPSKRIKEFLLSIVIVCSFGVWQFVGDLAGLPTMLTGLREQYTKIVFGFPRIQGTAIEPLYFGGMLLVPLFLTLSKIFDDLKYQKLYRAILHFSFIFIVFILTLSKGAWLAFGIGLGLYLVYNSKSLWLKFIDLKLASFLKIIFTLVVVLAGAYFLFTPLRAGVDTTVNHVLATFDGNSTTIVERSRFVDGALELLQTNPILGIGGGQYGTNFELGSDGGFLIVNNAYLEVWLEHGLFALIVFCLFLFLPIFKLLKTKSPKNDWIVSGLIFGLISYYVQWFTFSPVFIMPIFILVGLAFCYAQNADIKL